MTRQNKFARAVAKRESDAASPTPPDNTHTTKQTVTMTRHLHNQLGRLLSDLALEHHVRMPLGPVGVRLYEIFLDDPKLQQEVVKRMT
jgi:hypothetical protein